MSENNKSNEKALEKKITEINRDIELYRQAIENAEGALEEAERELNELLADNYEPALPIEPRP